MNAFSATTNDPAMTFTLEDFIELADTDDATYFNYSIIEARGNLIYTDHSLIDDYLPELVKMCTTVSLDENEYKIVIIFPINGGGNPIIGYNIIYLLSIFVLGISVIGVPIIIGILIIIAENALT